MLKNSSSITYVHLALVHVFGLASAVLGLLAEDEKHLKEEDVSLPALPEDLLGVPDLEGILEDHFSMSSKVVLRNNQRSKFNDIVESQSRKCTMKTKDSLSNYEQNGNCLEPT